MAPPLSHWNGYRLNIVIVERSVDGLLSRVVFAVLSPFDSLGFVVVVIQISVSHLDEYGVRLFLQLVWSDPPEVGDLVEVVSPQT